MHLPSLAPVYHVNITMTLADESQTLQLGNWRKARLGDISIPRRIWLEDDDEVLCWEWSSEEPNERPVIARPGGDLLADFLRIERASPRTILSFAQIHGPLLLCDHAKPYMHRSPDPRAVPRLTNDPLVRERIRGSQPDQLHGNGICVPVGREPIRDWWDWSRIVSACLEAGSRLQEGTLVSRDLRIMAHAVWGWTNGETETCEPSLTLGAQKHEFGVYLETLVASTDLRLHFEAWPFPPRIAIKSSTMLGMVMYHLVMHLMGGSGLTICSNCGEPFAPEERRRPQGKRHWCSKAECKRAARAAAQRDYRRRLKTRRE